MSTSGLKDQKNYGSHTIDYNDCVF